MSCTGKSFAFYKQEEVIFFCKNVWKVLAFKENNVKIKNTRFPVISLKFLIANWDALIPFFRVSFLCVKSTTLLFIFSPYVWGLLLQPKARGLGPCPLWPPLKPSVSTGGSTSVYSSAVPFGIKYNSCISGSLQMILFHNLQNDVNVIFAKKLLKWLKFSQ